MTTRTDLAKLSEQLGDEMVLSVYVSRENDDPGMGEAWLRRLSAAMEAVHADVMAESPAEAPGLERASEWVISAMDSFGRILPHEGWCVFATAEQVVHAGPLPFQPEESVRWRRGPFVAPMVRALKSSHPVTLGLVDKWNAKLYRFSDEELSPTLEFEADPDLTDASDVGVAKRASAASGMRGMTGTDFAQRSRAEEVKRLRAEVVAAIQTSCEDCAGAVVGGTPEAVSAVAKALAETLPGRVVEVPELSFDTPRHEVVARLRDAASRLTEARQSMLLEASEDPNRGSTGWNSTYRALAAGAVDTLMVARGMITEAPEDAERLVRLALAQGADVEEVGGALGEHLMTAHDGTAARLRFVPASLQP